MNREDVIRMAREAGAVIDRVYLNAAFAPEELERFAALVAAAEREACAAMFDHVVQRGGTTIGDAIRARGEKA